jgi:hypothetical protein
VTEPAIGPHDAPLHAGQVVRRVLLRRNIVIDAETAQLVAAAVQAALGGYLHRNRNARLVLSAQLNMGTPGAWVLLS